MIVARLLPPAVALALAACGGVAPEPDLTDVREAARGRIEVRAAGASDPAPAVGAALAADVAAAEFVALPPGEPRTGLAWVTVETPGAPQGEVLAWLVLWGTSSNSALAVVEASTGSVIFSSAGSRSP